MSEAEEELDRLRCAAYLGHPPARQRLGEEAPTRPEDLRDWILGLDAWGDEIAVRALLALAGLRTRQGLPPAPAGAVAASEALIRCPCAEHERKARIAWTEDADWSGEFEWAELAADEGWKLAWRSSPEQVRAAIEDHLLPWALAPV